MKGMVQTVLGPVAPETLGFTLPHEHLSANIARVFYKAPECRPHLQDDKISLNNLGWIRQYPYSSMENMQLAGPAVDAAVSRSVARFKEGGGGTIVENTTPGIEPNFAFMKKISLEIGINIVAGTGYYVDNSQPDENKAMSEEELSKIMIRDIEEGCTPDIKCGIIGEIGCSWPLTDFERRSLRSSAAVEAQTGVPVMIHPGRDPTAPEEIVRVFSEAGGNPKRVVMAHLDRTLLELSDLLEFASMGSYLEYDLFGIETSMYQQATSIDMPSDAQRIKMIGHLIENGFVDRITLSHDIHTRHRLEDYGGHGYTHLMETVVPMMKRRGITDAQIHSMTVTNPAQWLTFVK